MIGRIGRLYTRYCLENARLETPGDDLLDEFGRRIGHVDTVGIRGNRAYVTGWTTATRVGFCLDGHRVETVPNLQRADVQQALGDEDIEPNVGFFLEQPLRPGQMLLSIELEGNRYIHPLPRLTERAIRRARHSVAMPFLRDLASVSPLLVNWAMTRNPALPSQVKQRLGLSEHVAHEIKPGVPLFAAPAEGAKAIPDDTPITIVLPVYNSFALLPEVLDRVVKHTDLPWHLVVIEDCSTDEQVRPWLRDWVKAQDEGRVTLVENEENKGFITSVNKGLAIGLERKEHVVLLNSDAFVPEGWASRLLRPIFAHDNVASVTPMSNDAEIFTVPAICKRGDLNAGEVDKIDAMARRFHPDADLAVAPTGVGFCMAINHAYLAQEPSLDTSFGRGYGEEVDWCQKTRKRGGRHLGLPSLFVEHRGGSSFGSAEKLKLVQQNNAKISRRYPGYDREVQSFIKSDPLATPRLALGLALLAERAVGAVPIYLGHSMGGGADTYLTKRIEEDLERAGGAVVIRVGGAYRWQVELHMPGGMTRAVMDEFEIMCTLLDVLPAHHLVYSCAAGDRDPVEIPDLIQEMRRSKADSIEVLFHDYFPISPSYCLLDGEGVYRGVPEKGLANKFHRTRRPDGSWVSLRHWQAAWGKLIDAADKVTVFSEDSKDHVIKAYPAAKPRIAVEPHELPVPAASLRVKEPKPGAARVIGVLGNIGYQKGAEVISELSRMMTRKTGLKLVVIGNVDPAYPIADPSKIHGTYRVSEIPALVDKYGITDWLIPSIWPETFSYATHEALATGLPVYSFDIGAHGAAVAAAPNGATIEFPDDKSKYAEALYDTLSLAATQDSSETAKADLAAAE